jgi:polar amino acid transport system substrate-binding protein
MLGLRQSSLAVGAGWATVLLLAAESHADLREIRAAGRLRVLSTESAPAFFSRKPGARPGLEREILEGFCKLHKLDLTAPVPSASGLLGALVKGEGDVAAGGLIVAEVPDVQFSAEILPSRYVILTRKPALPVLKTEELQDAKVGCPRGLAAASLGGIPASQFEDLGTPADVVAALKSGKLKAGIVGMEYAIPARAEDGALQLGTYVGGKLSLALAVRKDAPQLRDALNEYIANLRRTPTWNRLVLKYFGDGAIDILKAAR